jgi:hypothetical protein
MCTNVYKCAKIEDTTRNGMIFQSIPTGAKRNYMDLSYSAKVTTDLETQKK